MPPDAAGRPARSRLLLAGAGLLATAVFWGSAVPFNVVLLRYFDPFVLTALRMMLSVLILACVVAWREPGRLWQVPLGMRQFLVIGFFMAGFNVLFTLSVLWSNPITISAISVAMPLTGALVARAMLGARLERGFGVALLLTIGGGMLVVYGQPGFEAGSLGLQGGEVLMLVAMVSWNVYSLKAQQWLGQLGQVRLTFVSSLSTCLWLAAAMVLALVLGIARWPSQTPPTEVFAMVFYLALFSAAVGNFLWNFGISVLGLPISSLYVNLSAVFAVLIAMAFGYHPTWLQVGGGLIVMAGVLYMQLRKLRTASA
ncbi:MAG: DMT family transporter [Reyranellaceae bacterium]